MIEFLFTLPFNTFMFIMKYLGSLLFWVALVSYTWSFRHDLWDWVCDMFYALKSRVKGLRKGKKITEKPEDYIL